MTLDLTDRVALVTGATGQLGRVMARTLAQAGAHVAVHYRGNETKARELCGELERLGRKAVAVQAEVANRDAVFAMRDAVKAALGDPHIVVANAVSQVHPWTTLLEEDPADYEDQFRSCVMQNVLLAKAFIPAMIARKGGRYIGINTECTMQLAPRQSAYTSGKRGMDAVLRVLAREVGEHQITVNQVAPGWTISDRDREKGTEVSESYSKNVPLRRRGTDQEIANVVAFLASDLASYVTGAYVPVCGGNVMPAV
ncbi:MAG: SDR family oxidoreductase [Planctomycetota bacterium]|nr:SDR family oxidoreductase [Planctomycetota bacterium]